MSKLKLRLLVSMQTLKLAPADKQRFDQRRDDNAAALGLVDDSRASATVK